MTCTVHSAVFILCEEYLAVSFKRIMRTNKFYMTACFLFAFSINIFPSLYSFLIFSFSIFAFPLFSILKNILETLCAHSFPSLVSTLNLCLAKWLGVHSNGVQLSVCAICDSY